MYNYQPTNTYAFVNGMEGAKGYQVLPNQTVLLLDSENSYLYVKQANAIGQANIQIFELKQVEEAKKPQYVTKDELMKILEDMKNG